MLCHHTECKFFECHGDLFIIMQNVILLCVVMLNVVMLSVLLLIVVAPFKRLILLIIYEQANKLECYITLDWKGLPVINASLLDHLYVIKKMKCCESGPRGHVCSMSFSS
jgi:hypothetical protein